MEIRITSKRKNCCLLHFIVNNQYYILQTGNAQGDYTLTTTLYKGKCKCHCENIGRIYGGMDQILNGEYNRKTIKQIDINELKQFLKDNFDYTYKEWLERKEEDK